MEIAKNIFLYQSAKKIIFLRAHFCVIKQNLENIVEFVWKSPKTVTYFLTNNISYDHICYSMCNVNTLIIVTTCIIVHDVLVFYGLRSHRKLINLFWIATRRPLRGEVYNLSLRRFSCAGHSNGQHAHGTVYVSATVLFLEPV